MSRLFLSPSGTSPSTMRRASPSTMAVLPTPGSPMSTGLFLVRRDSTWIDAADLLVAADDRVELALAGRLGEVAAVPLERLVLLLGVLAGDAVAAPDLAAARSAARSRLDAEPVGQREQQVLGREVLVVQLARASSAVSSTASQLRDRDGLAAVGLGSLADRLVGPVAQRQRRQRRPSAGWAARRRRPGRGGRRAGGRA